MNRSPRLSSAPRGRHLVGWALLLALSSCSPGDSVEIEHTRPIRGLQTRLRPGATGEDRFGGGMGAPTAAAPTTPLANPFSWTVPDGWEELEPTQYRLINLRYLANPDLECALTVLPGDGGGMAANVNRWRDQIGLAPLDMAEVLALPKTSLLGESATFVDLRGSYSGMTSQAQEGWGLSGLVLVTDRFTLFVKMTGPGELVTQEQPNFDAFCATLRAVFPDEASDPHAGHDHPPGEHPTSSDSEAASGGSGSGSFAFVMPAGWRDGPPKSTREVNLLAGEGSQCYVIVLGGESGGLEGNINRWRGEVGLAPLDAAGIQQLKTIDILGEMTPLLEVSGDYQGMGGPGGESMTVLGVPLIRPGSSIFVKMVGPEKEIAQERENFLKFVASLEEVAR